MENSLVISYETKHALTIKSNTCILWLLPQKNEKFCSHINKYVNVYSSLIHNSPRLKTIKMSINQQLVKHVYIRIMDNYSAIKRKRLLIHATTSMNLKQILLNQKLIPKITYCMILLDNILDMATFQRQRTDQWLPQVREGQENREKGRLI